jgi:hypothetical protein
MAQGEGGRTPGPQAGNPTGARDTTQPSRRAVRSSAGNAGRPRPVVASTCSPSSAAARTCPTSTRTACATTPVAASWRRSTCPRWRPGRATSGWTRCASPAGPTRPRSSWPPPCWSSGETGGADPRTTPGGGCSGTSARADSYSTAAPETTAWSHSGCTSSHRRPTCSSRRSGQPDPPAALSALRSCRAPRPSACRHPASGPPRS